MQMLKRIKQFNYSCQSYSMKNNLLTKLMKLLIKLLTTKNKAMQLLN